MHAPTTAARHVGVSVVIPALNAARTLGVQLEALAAQVTDRAFEVLVADNGSTDDTAAVVAAFAGRLPRLRLIDASSRSGTNVARNAGTAAAEGDYVLLCDADDEVDPNWLDALASGLESAEAVGGRLDRVRLNADFVQRWGIPAPGALGISTHLDFLPRPIGANAGYHKSVWQELGGFDEDYVRGGTETEFFWRLQLRGLRLLDVPEAVVSYRMRSTYKTLVRQMYIWGRQSPMLYRDFRGQGMTWDPRSSARSWLHALRLLRSVGRGREQQLFLSRQVAYCLGRLVGSAKYRVLYL